MRKLPCNETTAAFHHRDCVGDLMNRGQGSSLVKRGRCGYGVGVRDTGTSVRPCDGISGEIRILMLRIYNS
ncbi:unnamed protein product [Merluccius merluccius]